jgi:hypothetical protein
VLVVQLIRAADMPAIARTVNPAVVRIVWPTQPTIVDPKQFPEMAAVVAKLFAGASVELSRIAAMRKGLL